MYFHSFFDALFPCCFVLNWPLKVALHPPQNLTPRLKNNWPILVRKLDIMSKSRTFMYHIFLPLGHSEKSRSLGLSLSQILEGPYMCYM